jgi:hypothetical protein
MNKRRSANRRRSIATLAELFEQVAPDEIDEAGEELRALGVDPSAAAGRLEQLALRSLQERILREHSDAVRTLTNRRRDVDLAHKLN